MKHNILLLDDDPAALYGYSAYLKKMGHNTVEATSLAHARKELERNRFDAFVLDLVLGDGSGTEIIREIKDMHAAASVIIVSGKGDIPVAVEAMKQGADNFLTKPVNMAELEIFIKKSIELYPLKQKEIARNLLQSRYAPYLGEDPQMKRVFDNAKIVSLSESPVLIDGESGTGKGELAKWIHNNSSRRSLSFIDVNCSGLRGELLASELFGHAKGAFTSAVSDRQGLVEAADRGTLFLDEIGDMDVQVQSQLIKVLEEKTYRRIGETKQRMSDFRLICATNKDLGKEVTEGRFRKDLYFRIKVFPIWIPPLRDRIDEIKGLSQNILSRLGFPETVLSAEALQHLKEYDWPGNIRELKNLIERAVLLSGGGTLMPDHFNGIKCSTAMTGIDQAMPDLKRIERKYIQEVIDRFHGDMGRAASALGMSRATLYRKVKK